MAWSCRAFVEQKALIEVQLDHDDASTRAIYDRGGRWKDRATLMQLCGGSDRRDAQQSTRQASAGRLTRHHRGSRAALQGGFLFLKWSFFGAKSGDAPCRPAGFSKWLHAHRSAQIVNLLRAGMA
jgi:hypothetical protein